MNECIEVFKLDIVSFILLGFATCLFIIASIKHWLVFIDITNKLKNKSNDNKNNS